MVVTKLIFVVLYIKWTGTTSECEYTDSDGKVSRFFFFEHIVRNNVERNASANQKSRLWDYFVLISHFDCREEKGAQLFTLSDFHSNIFNINIDFFCE